MEYQKIRVGDKVRCGVHVCGEWVPTQLGIVVSQTFDGSVSGVDVMSMHGGAPWVQQEVTAHLRREDAEECTCPAADMPFDRCCKAA